MIILAEIDKDNICIGLKRTKEIIEDETHIEIDEYDISILGKRYENGEWKKVEQTEPEETIEPEIKLEDKVNFLYYKEMGLI